jgi:S-adenosylmethionine decarboxylase
MRFRLTPACPGPAYIRGMKGLHLTADLYQCRCDPAWLADAARLQAWCASAVHAVGLQPLAQAYHSQDRGGTSCAVLMTGAHVCLHTWPGEKAVTADVFVSQGDGDHAAQARALMLAMVERFQPEWTEQRSLDRGEEE